MPRRGQDAVICVYRRNEELIDHKKEQKESIFASSVISARETLAESFGFAQSPRRAPGR